MFHFISKSYIFFLIIVILIFFLSPIAYFADSNLSLSQSNSSNELFYFTNADYAWPVPGYTRISSKFGKRVSPTTGASTYHSGIDIPAPPGSHIIAVQSGIVTFASWGAAGGYTVVIKNDNISISYLHVSPEYLVAINDVVTKGQVISTVGPKNVYGIQNNPYKDSDGNPTNGASTGPHLHLTIKVDGVAVNPLSFLE